MYAHMLGTMIDRYVLETHCGCGVQSTLPAVGEINGGTTYCRGEYRCQVQRSKAEVVDLQDSQA